MWGELVLSSGSSARPRLMAVFPSFKCIFKFSPKPSSCCLAMVTGQDASRRARRGDSTPMRRGHGDPSSGNLQEGLSRALPSWDGGTDVWSGLQTARSLSPNFSLFDWPELLPLEFHSFGYSCEMSVHLLELASEPLVLE